MSRSVDATTVEPASNSIVAPIKGLIVFYCRNTRRRIIRRHRRSRLLPRVWLMKSYRVLLIERRNRPWKQGATHVPGNVAVPHAKTVIRRPEADHSRYRHRIRISNLALPHGAAKFPLRPPCTLIVGAITSTAPRSPPYRCSRRAGPAAPDPQLSRRCSPPCRWQRHDRLTLTTSACAPLLTTVAVALAARRHRTRVIPLLTTVAPLAERAGCDRNRVARADRHAR